MLLRVTHVGSCTNDNKRTPGTTLRVLGDCFFSTATLLPRRLLLEHLSDYSSRRDKVVGAAFDPHDKSA